MVALFFWGRLPFKKNYVVFHLKIFRSSSIFVKNIVFILVLFGCIILNEVIFPFPKELRSSSIFKKLRSSSIFKNIEVVFHISSSWVNIRLHTKTQLRRLPGSGSKCNHSFFFRSSSFFHFLRSSSFLIFCWGCLHFFYFFLRSSSFF